VAVDPPRDVDQVIAAAARRGVRISRVVETRVHNDYVTRGLPVQDGDRTEIDADAGPALRAVATPGHTPHHTAYAAYALEGNGPAMLGDSLAAPATRAGTVEGRDRAVVGPFVAAAVLGARDGRRLSGTVSGHTLQRIFALVLLVLLVLPAVAAFMVIDAVL
jgi:hypothetical protein